MSGKKDYKKITQNIKDKSYGNILLIILAIIFFSFVCYFIYYNSSRELIYSVEREEIETILESEDNFYIVKRSSDGFLELYDFEKNKIIDESYIEIEGPYTNLGNDFFLVKSKDEKYGIIDSKGKDIIPLKYESIICDYGEYGVEEFTAFTAEKMDLYDMNGNVLYTRSGEHYYNYYMDDLSDEIIFHFNDKYSYLLENGKLGIIDKNGKILINPSYEINVEKKSNNYTVYDDLDSVVVKTTDKYFFILTRDSKMGIIDEQLNNLLNFEFDDIVYDENLGVFLTVRNGKNYAYDINGNLIHSFTKKFDLNYEYQYFGNINFDYTSYRVNDEETVTFDKNFNFIDDDVLYLGKNNYIAFGDNEKPILKSYSGKTLMTKDLIYYLYNKKNNIIACDYDENGATKDCSLLDENGKILTEDLYDEIISTEYNNYSEFTVNKGGRCGLIDDNGKYIITLNDKYSDENTCGYYYFSKDGYYIVSENRINTNNKIGLVDKNNNEIIEPNDFFSIDYYSDNFIVALKNYGKTEIYNIKGEMVKTELEESDSLERFIKKEDKKYYFLGSSPSTNNIYLYTLTQKRA